MDDKPKPKSIPVVNLQSPTLASNVCGVDYLTGNGQIQLQVLDLRPVFGAQLPPAAADLPEVFFELGRFALTPRALRQLSDSVIATIRKFEEAHGPLPTINEFVARAAISTLQMPPASPPPKEDA